MIYRFIILSDEVENFRRDILIDSESPFLDLHEAILDSVGYTKDQVTSFFTCDDDWTKQLEITLVEMDNDVADEDFFTMEDTYLSDLLDEERQKLVYVFDYLAERCFYLELHEIITGKKLKKAECTRKDGEPPIQIQDINESLTIEAATSRSMDDYFDDEFNLDEYDEEDFGNLSESDPFDEV